VPVTVKTAMTSVKKQAPEELRFVVEQKKKKQKNRFWASRDEAGGTATKERVKTSRL